jgi:hypothetical protein
MRDITVFILSEALLFGILMNGTIEIWVGPSLLSLYVLFVIGVACAERGCGCCAEGGQDGDSSSSSSSFASSSDYRLELMADVRTQEYYNTSPTGSEEGNSPKGRVRRRRRRSDNIYDSEEQEGETDDEEDEEEEGIEGVSWPRGASVIGKMLYWLQLPYMLMACMTVNMHAPLARNVPTHT